MLYKAKVAVCSDIRTKQATRIERHVEIWMLNLVVREIKPIGFKGLILKYQACGERGQEISIKRLLGCWCDGYRSRSLNSYKLYDDKVW